MAGQKIIEQEDYMDIDKEIESKSINDMISYPDEGFEDIFETADPVKPENVSTPDIETKDEVFDYNLVNWGVQTDHYGDQTVLFNRGLSQIGRELKGQLRDETIRNFGENVREKVMQNNMVSPDYLEKELERIEFYGEDRYNDVETGDTVAELPLPGETVLADDLSDFLVEGYGEEFDDEISTDSGYSLEL